MKRWWIVCLMSLAALAEPAVRPGWLGFSFTHHVAGEEQWLMVCAVQPGSPADEAGIRQNDVITAIDRKPIRFTDSAALLETLALVRPGQRVKFSVIHDQRKKERVVTAAPMSDEQYERWKTNLQMARRARNARP